MEQIIHQQRFRQDYLEDGLEHVVNVDAKLSNLGNPKAHFSLTGKICISQNGRLREHSAGCIHEEILAQFPELKGFASLHLSDSDGVPMHAVANGWYWAGGTKWNGTPNIDFLASHLRIHQEDADYIVAEVTSGRMDKDTFTVLVESLHPRWKAEAESAIAFLQGGPAPEFDIPALEIGCFHDFR
jgi:hypothetical protein